MERLKVDINFEEDKDILDKMKQAYLNCPTAIKYVKSLGIPDEKIDDNITKIYDFVSDIDYCKNCPGIKKCKKNNPLLCSKITYEYGYVDRQLVPCKEFLKQLVFEKQFIIRDFDDSWLDTNIKDLDQTNPRKKAINQYAKFIKNDDKSWIFINGSINSGRSYLAATIAIDCARRNKGPLIFANCSKRFRELSDVYYKAKEKFQNELNKYCSCPILILDDFGNEFKNDLVRDAILFEIISARCNKNLFTIMTSDFSIDEIVELYSTTKPGTIRAKQIGKYLKATTKEEINLGDLPVYK